MFGTVAAAFMPAAVGGVAVAVGLGFVFYVADFRDMSVLSFNIITLLGIGMGIDYSLFYVNRYREELANGHSTESAIVRTHASAGTAILFSGITSVIGLASLLLFDLTVLDSVGIGAIVVISIALLSAQTLMPAVLGVVGQRVNALPIPTFGKFGDGFWHRMADGVMRRPTRSAFANGHYPRRSCNPIQRCPTGHSRRYDLANELRVEAGVRRVAGAVRMGYFDRSDRSVRI